MGKKRIEIKGHNIPNSSNGVFPLSSQLPVWILVRVMNLPWLAQRVAATTWIPSIMLTLVVRALWFIVTHSVPGKTNPEIHLLSVSLEGRVQPKPPPPPGTPNHLSLLPLKTYKPHSLGGRQATPSDLDLVQVKYNIFLKVELTVPQKDKIPRRPSTSGIALHIDLLNLGLTYPSSHSLRECSVTSKLPLDNFLYWGGRPLHASKCYGRKCLVKTSPKRIWKGFIS